MAKLPHNDSLVATVGEFAAVANITSDSSYYDDYAYAHSDLNPTIHFTGDKSRLYSFNSVTDTFTRTVLSVPQIFRLVLYSSTEE